MAVFAVKVSHEKVVLMSYKKGSMLNVLVPSAHAKARKVKHGGKQQPHRA